MSRVKVSVVLSTAVGREVCVLDLATGKKKVYSCSPREAVMAAHAQEHGDWNTWDYESRYGDLVRFGQHTVLCGDWSTFCCDCHALSLA